SSAIISNRSPQLSSCAPTPLWTAAPPRQATGSQLPATSWGRSEGGGDIERVALSLRHDRLEFAMSYSIRTRSALPAPGPAFVHLKVHSPYSLWKGAIPPPAFAKLGGAPGFPAVAITDTNNLFGALEFSDRLADAGVQPIVGCSLQIDF